MPSTQNRAWRPTYQKPIISSPSPTRRQREWRSELNELRDMLNGVRKEASRLHDVIQEHGAEDGIELNMEVVGEGLQTALGEVERLDALLTDRLYGGKTVIE